LGVSLMEIKVLHILYKVDIGGTEKAVLNYIREHQDKGIVNDTCSLYKGRLSNEYEKYSNKHINIQTSNLLKSYFKLKKHINKEKYDIIYTYGFRVNLLLRFMPKNFKLIYGIRGLETNVSNFTYYLNKLTLKRNDLLITNSELSKNSIQKKYKLKENKTITIHNGTYIPNEGRKYEYRNELNLIIIANLNKVKGFDYLLPAIKKIKKSGISINLKILGEGPERSNIESYINRNDLEKNIQLYGQVKNVYKYLSESDILISASLSEGLSNAIMEGMAYGLPIIATEVGGSPELVIPQKSGVLIPPQNTEALVKSIKFYNNHPALIKKHGLYGRKLMKTNFSFEKLVNENNKTFRALSNNRF